MKKSYIITLSVIGLFVLVTGVAFAFFYATNNDSDVDVTGSAKEINAVEYLPGSSMDIPVSGIYPGWIGVMDFTVGKPDGVTAGVGTYEIVLETDIDPAYSDWITYELYKSTDMGKSITRVEGTLSDDVFNLYVDDSLTPNGYTIPDDAFIDGVANSTTGNVSVDKQSYDFSTYQNTKYYLVMRFLNENINQNAAINKDFEIKVVMKEVAEEETIDPIVACTQDYTDRGLTPTSDEHFYYRENSDGTIEITNYRITGPKEVVIPCEIEGKQVESIRVGSFSDCELTNVIIPSTVISIGREAFSNNKLTNVIIPDSITMILEEAFSGNELLSNGVYKYATNEKGEIVYIMDYIGTDKEVVIPDTVRLIAENTFNSKGISEVTIPNSVRSIGPSAFMWNSLKTVSIPSGVTNINRDTFAYNLLETVELPETLITIEHGAFYENNLTDLKLPGSVTTIGPVSFYDNNLTNLVISSNVEIIESSAFGSNPMEMISILGKTELSEFTNLATSWYDGTPEIKFINN